MSNRVICMHVDKNFIDVLHVFLYSLRDNIDDNVTIYIFTNDLSYTDILLNYFKIEIVKCSFNKIFDLSGTMIHNESSYDHYKSNYLKMYLVDYMRDRVDKYLYLDADIIVNKDISCLFEQDNGCALSAVGDWFYFDKYSNKYKEKMIKAYLMRRSLCDKYFNAGVMFIDNKYLPEYSVLETYDRNSLLFKQYFDQDCLNYYFKNYHPMDFGFNSKPDALGVYFDNEFTFAHYNQIIEGSIVHFLSRNKPWIEIPLVSKFNMQLPYYMYYGVASNISGILSENFIKRVKHNSELFVEITNHFKDRKKLDFLDKDDFKFLLELSSKYNFKYKLEN